MAKTSKSSNVAPEVTMPMTMMTGTVYRAQSCLIFSNLEWAEQRMQKDACQLSMYKNATSRYMYGSYLVGSR